MIKNYLTPNTLEDAVSLKAQYGEKAKYLAGGTELNLALNKGKYETFIDLKNLKLNSIAKDSTGNIEIGASVTFQKLIVNELVPEQLKKAAAYMESRNIRNIATIGGNIGGGKTVGDLIPTLLVLDAKLKVCGKSELVTVESYIESKSADLIEKIVIPASELTKTYMSRVYSRTSNDLSLIGVAVSYTKAGNTISNLKVAIGGTASVVKRLPKVEAGLEGTELCKSTIVKLVKENVTPVSDVRGSKEFKAHVAGELVAECFGIN